MGSIDERRAGVVLTAPASIVPDLAPALTGNFVAKAFVLCLSFANLCFVNVWADLTNRELDLFKKYLVSWQQLTAAVLDVLLLAFLLLIPVCVATRLGNRRWITTLKVCIVAGLLLILNILRKSALPKVLPSWIDSQDLPLRILFAVAGFAAVILLVWKWGRNTIAVTNTLLVVLSPMLPLIVLSTAWNIYIQRAVDKPLLTMLPQKARAPRVLWFIFDEWDEALTFGRRPAGLTLPHLDRVRGESFHAEHAFPASRETVISVPSLLTGKTFVDKKWKGPSGLLLTYDRNRPPEQLIEQSNIFSEARVAGFNAGIAGNYLPYCRLFDVAACDWHSLLVFRPMEWEYPQTVGGYMLLTAKRQVEMLPFAMRIKWLRPIQDDENLKRSLLAVTYRQIHEAAMRFITDPRLNLVFVHWDIPHPPARFEPAKDDFSNNPANNYLDSLKLVDRTVRDIRLTLEKAGMWDASTVLFTADHPLRVDFWDPLMMGPPSAGKMVQSAEVPFLLKLAGQKDGFAYTTPMHAVVTKDLLLSIMKGELTGSQQVADWLDHHPPRR